jgi:hypothetical protein
MMAHTIEAPPVALLRFYSTYYKYNDNTIFKFSQAYLAINHS